MKYITISFVFAVVTLFSASHAQAQEAFIGEIRMFAGNFPPRGWAFCDGQLLPISQNAALFSLLGTNYGGDGRTTFGLPDLRGRAPVHAGTGPGLTPRSIGQKGGVESMSVKKGDDGSVQGQPYLSVHFIICLQGIYPSRS